MLKFLLNKRPGHNNNLVYLWLLKFKRIKKSQLRLENLGDFVRFMFIFCDKLIGENIKYHEIFFVSPHLYGSY